MKKKVFSISEKMVLVTTFEFFIFLLICITIKAKVMYASKTMYSMDRAFHEHYIYCYPNSVAQLVQNLWLLKSD